jgi:hypothetical protein
VVVVAAYSRRPLRLHYELTASGRELAGALLLLARWGGGDDVGVHHEACGAPVEARWWCPVCDEPVDGPVGDADDARYV